MEEMSISGVYSIDDVENGISISMYMIRGVPMTSVRFASVEVLKNHKLIEKDGIIFSSPTNVGSIDLRLCEVIQDGTIYHVNYCKNNEINDLLVKPREISRYKDYIIYLGEKV